MESFLIYSLEMTATLCRVLIRRKSCVNLWCSIKKGILNHNDDDNNNNTPMRIIDECGLPPLGCEEWNWGGNSRRGGAWIRAGFERTPLTNNQNKPKTIQPSISTKIFSFLVLRRPPASACTNKRSISSASGVKLEPTAAEPADPCLPDVLLVCWTICASVLASLMYHRFIKTEQALPRRPSFGPAPFTEDLAMLRDTYEFLGSPFSQGLV